MIETLHDRLDWTAWERLIAQHGITIDRPRHSAHPDHPSIIYPIDYGYVNDTISSDDHEIDVFVGSATVDPYGEKLVGAIWTTDHRKSDRECKFLWRCTPEEIYLVNGFINFDRRLMEGTLALRRPMRELWD